MEIETKLRCLELNLLLIILDLIFYLLWMFVCVFPASLLLLSTCGSYPSEELNCKEAFDGVVIYTSCFSAIHCLLFPFLVFYSRVFVRNMDSEHLHLVRRRSLFSAEFWFQHKWFVFLMLELWHIIEFNSFWCTCTIFNPFTTRLSTQIWIEWHSFHYFLCYSLSLAIFICWSVVAGLVWVAEYAQNKLQGNVG